MNLHALQTFSIKNRHITLDATTPGKISDLNDLADISYAILPNGPSKDVGAVERLYFKLGYPASARQSNPNAIGTAGAEFLDVLEEHGAKLASESAYFSSPMEFIYATLGNYRRRLKMEAVILGTGAINLPLPRGGMLKILPKDDTGYRPFENTSDVVLTGLMQFFGQWRKYNVHYAHAKGYEFTHLIAIMESLEATLIEKFPFVAGHVKFHEIGLPTDTADAVDKFLDL